jgi:hypothetical protein
MRPCHYDHPSSPRTCFLCAWDADPGPVGAAYRAAWDGTRPDARRLPGKPGRRRSGKPRAPLGVPP